MAKERKSKHFLNKPTYEGGNTALKLFISQHKVYPKTALKAEIEGTVILRYDINYKGIVTGAKIISGIGYGCDEEAIRLVKLLKFKVAKNRGVKATFHKTIKIHFRKPKKAKAEVSPLPVVSSIQYSYTISKQKESAEKTKPEVSKKGFSFVIQMPKQ